MCTIVYHATYKNRIASIRKGVLGGRGIKRSYEGAVECGKPGQFYVDLDLDCAGSFAESADNVADSTLDSGVVILRMDIQWLLSNHIIQSVQPDINNNHGNSSSRLVIGTVPSKFIQVLCKDREWRNLSTTATRYMAEY